MSFGLNPMEVVLLGGVALAVVGLIVLLVMVLVKYFR